MTKIDRDKVRKDFGSLVNMSASEIQRWLKTDASRDAGWKGPDGEAKESIGHASGRRIVKILGKKDEDLTADEYAHMRKVVGYIRRHSAQRPENLYTSRWRYSLMNWGHDPTKEDQR